MRSCYSWFFALLIGCAALSAPPAPPGIPPLGPVPFAEVQRIAGLAETEQRKPVNQARLQEWFLFHVGRFQQQLSGTAIGSQVRLGDLAAYKRRFPAPAGAGGADWNILWVDTGSGPTKERGEPFRLPRDQVDAYYRANNPKEKAMPWHEVQHGVLCEHALSAPGLVGAVQEHFYTNAYAEPTVEWLWTLTRVHNFEALARQAAADAEAYRARGEPVTFEVEHHLWSRAHIAWRAAWPASAPIRGLSDTLREEYARLSGVEVPAVEDVVRFYMEGGIRGIRGDRLPVPEWVLNADPVRATVEIRYDPARDVRDTRPDLVSHRLTFFVEELYRAPGAAILGRRKVTRGRLTLQLQTDDDAASLLVQIGGRKLSGIPVAGAASLRRFSLELDALKPELLRDQPFQVTFLHRHPEQVRGKQSFKIAVDYNDLTDAAGPALYHPSRAVFWIDLQGGTPGLPPVTVPPGTPAPPTLPPAAPGPGWLFRRTKVDAERFALAPSDVRSYQFTLLAAKDGRVSYRDELVLTSDGQDQGALREREVTWTVPPPFLPANQAVPLELAIRRVRDKPASAAGIRGCDVKVLTHLRPAPSRPEFKPIQLPQTLSLPSAADRRTEDWLTPDPAIYPGYDTLTLTLMVLVNSQRGERLSYTVEYEYGAAAAPPAGTQVRWEPTPAATDRDTDNLPPERGERKAITPGKKDGDDDARPPTAGEDVRWYVHPTGDFRFRVPRSWAIFPEHAHPLRPDKEYDHVGDGIDVDQIIVWRRFQGAMPPEGGFAEKVEALLKQHPRAAAALASFAGARALLVTYKTDNGYASTHLYLLRGGKRYYFHTYGEPAGTDFSRPPPVPDRLLRTLEFLKP